MELPEIRKQIDEIDNELLELFVRRMELASMALQQKKQSGKNILDESREKEILKRVSEKSGPISPYSARLFKEIIAISRDYQEKISSNPCRYGLIGGKLGHSFSPMIHKELGTPLYDLIETSGEKLSEVLNSKEYSGFNITIPFKKAAAKYCNVISREAKEVGCVNTIVREKDGKLYGYNTDLEGFIYSAESAGIDLKNKKVLILGSGGASMTAQAAAKRLCASEIVVVSRSGEVNYNNISEHSDSEIIVNATPVGMYPNNLEHLISLESFPHCCGLIELIYNPHRTTLIMEAEKLGIPHTDGLSMLVYQAKIAEEIFRHTTIPETEVKKIIKKIRQETSNIIIVGMPGCGKNTVGRLVAEAMSRKLLSIDDEIENNAGKKIADIFADDGEAVFRAMEREQAKALGKLSGFVIATGGGIVKDFTNYPPLHQNGRIYCLCRAVDKLATEGRPLSKDLETLKVMELERKPLYAHFSDCYIDNNGTPEEAAAMILEDYRENIRD